MNTSNFDKHKVDHLFVLVGENPLPNYVAARLLLHDGGTVHLVYTTKTKKPADFLGTELKKLKELNINITVKRVELGSSWADGYDIRKKIQDKIRPKGKPPLEGRIGLNYTGGTKAMAVHAYQALLELNLPTPIFNSSLGLELPNPVFTYLDSIKLQMCIDDNENRKTISVPAALAVSPPPRLEQILGLHNLSWKPDNLPVDKSQFPEAVENLCQLQRNSDIAKKWRDWCNKNLQQALDKENGGWKKDERIKQKLDISEIPDEIKKIFRDELKWNLDKSDTELDIQKVKERRGINLSHICEWLNSGWLEDYVLWQIEKVASKYDIQEIKRSLHIQDPEDYSRNKDQFEFDVAFLRGYQLFAISCSQTPDHSRSKQKLFEAHLRAKQLGGDEARVALVCWYKEDTSKLKKELSFVLDDDKIEVFGYQDLESKEFAKKLNNWIFRNI
jgi:hypothetical protein